MPYPGLLHPEPLPLWQTTADPYLLSRHSNTILYQSLWGPWVLVHTRFVWALWASLEGMQFDSKCDFAPPTILLGLLLCTWMWDISKVAPAPCSHCCSETTSIYLKYPEGVQDKDAFIAEKRWRSLWHKTGLCNTRFRGFWFNTMTCGQHPPQGSWTAHTPLMWFPIQHHNMQKVDASIKGWLLLVSLGCKVLYWFSHLKPFSLDTIRILEKSRGLPGDYSVY